MNKKYLHHIVTRIRVVKVWYLALAFVVLAIGAVFMLRQNNLGMVDLREKVYAADKNNTNVEQALQDLRAYVYSHMNTQLTSGGDSVYPPLQLKYTYQRLSDAAVKASEQANATVYSDAQAECERRYPGSFSGGPRVPCIKQYVDSHGVKTQTVPDSLYKFDFISPRWSPDLAGFLVLFAGLAGILLALRILVGYLARTFL